MRFVLLRALFVLVWLSSAPRVSLAKEPAVARGARNWRDAPAIVELDTTADIVAIGDVHGDYKRLIHLLKKTGLVPQTPQSPSEAAWPTSLTARIARPVKCCRSSTA